MQIQGETIRKPLSAGSAVTITAKNAASLQYRGLVGTLSTIVRQEGARALYNGLSAGLQRQMCFASVRLGMYDSVKGVYQSVLHGKKIKLPFLIDLFIY